LAGEPRQLSFYSDSYIVGGSFKQYTLYTSFLRSHLLYAPRIAGIMEANHHRPVGTREIRFGTTKPASEPADCLPEIFMPSRGNIWGKGVRKAGDQGFPIVDWS
jgi:hypothetical protein